MTATGAPPGVRSSSPVKARPANGRTPRTSKKFADTSRPRGCSGRAPTSDVPFDMTTSIDPEARWVPGDPDRLRQIVWNLLSNAVKFTPPRGTVSLVLVPASTGVCLEVSDTGRGIEPAFLPHVFDRFSQAEGEEMRGVRGLGIGLAIVRELAEAHGGAVEARSDGPGTGATFAVTLPGRLPQAPARSAVG